MKIIFYLLMFFLCVINCFAQKEAANWYFGYNAGVTFNQSAAVALTDGKIQTEEGSAAISDSRGNLLFYSNGVTLINRAHLLLKNSSGLFGDRSSTQNVVIIPQPGNDSIYFVFTIASIQLEDEGLNYSVVNMRGDNGFGEVIQKNISLLKPAFEKITAVRHCNNRDIWVTVRKWNSDQYFSYLVTSNGVAASPVVSSTGFYVGDILSNSVGAIKFSIKGNRLAAVYGYGIDKVELLDFNNQTGLLTNSIVFDANNFSGALDFSGTYGIEFSPDNRLLYVSVYNNVDDPPILYQFNITSNNAMTILASRQTISQTSFGGIGNIQIATDGRLYVAYPGKKFLGIINQPNMPGAGCNFQMEGLQVVTPNGGQTVKLGLPTFMESYFDAAFVPFDFIRSAGSCTDRDIVFVINRINGIDSLHWFFGDGTESTVQSLSQAHHYTSPGYYDVKLKIFRPGCSGELEEMIIKQIWIADSPHFLGADIEGCELSNSILQTNITGVNYYWNNGSTAGSITVSGEGIYWLQLEKNGCILRDSVVVKKTQPPGIDLGHDALVCANEPIKLDAGILHASYLWNTGDTTKIISINKPGKYKVTVTPGSGGCIATDSINVTWGDCELLIPSAFSPNGDEKNETFGLTSPIMLRSFSMRIYNRFGQVVFSTNNQLNKWNGFIKNKPAPIGLYPWIIIYTNKTGFQQTEKGTVLLIR